MEKTTIISKSDLLSNWLGNRNLTRKTLEVFPEESLFEHSIGGMRSFADLIKEIITLAVPGLEGIVFNKDENYSHELPLFSKSELLEKWDQDTPRIIELYNLISEEKFKEKFNLFGQYEGKIIHHIEYLIENEIHHRAQGFVYLRSLGIAPPFFWERD